MIQMDAITSGADVLKGHHSSDFLDVTVLL